MTWPKLSCQLSTFLKGFFSETTKTISLKFHMQPRGKGGKNVHIFGLGHMSKIAAMPIYGYNLKNLLQSHWADCLETCYDASGE